MHATAPDTTADRSTGRAGSSQSARHHSWPLFRTRVHHTPPDMCTTAYHSSGRGFITLRPTPQLPTLQDAGSSQWRPLTHVGYKGPVLLESANTRIDMFSRTRVHSSWHVTVYEVVYVCTRLTNGAQLSTNTAHSSQMQSINTNTHTGQFIKQLNANMVNKHSKYEL